MQGAKLIGHVGQVNNKINCSKRLVIRWHDQGVITKITVKILIVIGLTGVLCPGV